MGISIRINKEKPNWYGMYDCKCGNTTISKNDNYCGKCGKKIRWVENRD